MNRLLVLVVGMGLMATTEPSFAADLQAGGDLFNDNCAVCHGAKAQGYPQEVVPDGAVRIKKLAGDSAYWDFPTFKKAVMEGRDDKDRPMRMMPVFGKVGLYQPPGQMLTDDDLQNIQAYIQTLAPKG